LRTVGAVLLVVAAIALPSIGSAQNLYKRTDENGIIQYLDSIPPDYCFLLIATAKCPTEADKRASRAAEADKRAKDEIARRDRMLLETYGSVADIQYLRDRRLELLESQIKLTEVYLGNLDKRLADLQAEASNYKPYSTREDAPQIPEDLALDISRTTASITLYEQTLARVRVDQAALKKLFDDDIARFIEIKGE
jgi:hypothetical protein